MAGVFDFFLGDWVGDEDGEPGPGSAQRSYRMTFDRLIEMRHRSAFPDTDPHEELALIALGAEPVRMWEFHSEGYVITYELTESNRPTLVFDSTHTVPPAHRARLTVTLVGDDAFEEVFELGAGDGELQELVRIRWSRHVAIGG